MKENVISDLNEIAAATEAAATAIMDACETILRLPSGAEAEAAVGRIYEACTFQDLVGQRVARVVRALEGDGLGAGVKGLCHG
jgi:chemotaxis protein CheZ